MGDPLASFLVFHRTPLCENFELGVPYFYVKRQEQVALGQAR